MNREFDLDNSEIDQNNSTFGIEDLEKEKDLLPKDAETPVEVFWLNNF